jgi:hypothetical protein
MLIEKRYSPIFLQAEAELSTMQSVCVSYHKAREVGNGEALQGEGIHEIRGSRGCGWEELGRTGRGWQELIVWC